ncbi:MAG TPA: beta-ketoacyl-[acyl-carrier-protein] synthase family protein [Streptosporangiaceae bacterium]|nr:beta-ketoacyl-[acyl-carrier-protein] synthase family protein [Streptosporangiaceae bacterium]
MTRRTVITGIGTVAPGEPGTKAFWDMITRGQTATRTISFFDPAQFRSQMAAECDFDPLTAGLTPQEARRMDRAVQLAVVAAREAIADSGLVYEDGDPHRTGVSIGSACGCTMGLEQEYRVVSNGGRDWVVDASYAVPHLYGYHVPSTLTCEVAWAAGAEGPAALISTGCTSGIDAIGHARQVLQEGGADVIIAGASDAPISPISVACFDAIKATSPMNDDPEHASRPFDISRQGFVLGEGAAVLVLEELEHARRRGAHVYAEIAGYGARANATHMTGLKPDGREMSVAIDTAMAEARIGPDSVGYINAHGSGTKQNDVHETNAFKRSLGQHAYRIPVSSIKSMVGHSLGAIGAIEVAACALAIETSVVPPTANLHDGDPQCDLDYVPLEAREQRVDSALCVGSGFGGFQSAMLLTRTGARSS